MDALSMLKYWRGGGGGRGGTGSHGTATAATTNIKAAATNTIMAETDDDEADEDNDDEGPFFDLEFAVPDEGDEGDGEEKESEESDGEREEFDFAVSSGGSNGGGGRADGDLSLSPSDDLFFKGRLVPLETAIFGAAGEPNSKPAQIPAVSFLKSATKFRVFLLGLKKPRPPAGPLSPPEPPRSRSAAAKPRTAATTVGQSKLFTVKFKVEEVPIVSLFTRDNSSRGGSKSAKEAAATAEVDGVSEAKRLLSKYMKMIKPLYVRASKRYGEKLRLSAQLGLGKVEGGGSPEQAPEQQLSPPPPPPDATTKAEAAGAGACVKKEKQQQQQQGNAISVNGNLPAGLRVVCKHLGKSRSASAAVGPAGGAQLTNQRRDDSLLQQQDGIQSAILHCKRSFNASSPPPMGKGQETSSV